MGMPPIEMYTMVPKSQEASIVRHHEQTQNQAAQSNITSHIDAVILQNSQQTVRSEESRKEDYRYDAKEKGNGQYEENKGRKKKDGKEEEKDEKSGKTSARPGGFDVRI